MWSLVGHHMPVNIKYLHFFFRNLNLDELQLSSEEIPDGQIVFWGISALSDSVCGKISLHIWKNKLYFVEKSIRKIENVPVVVGTDHRRKLNGRSHLAASGGQSGWFDGCAARNAGWLSSSRSMRNMIGYGRKSTWNLWTKRTKNQHFWIDKNVCIVQAKYLRALNTCGTRQQSAIVISSPTQNLPADVDSNFSIARKPRVIQCWAHSFFFSSPTWISTIRFCRGWMPDVITSHISRTLLRLCTSCGRIGRCGRVSSK